MKLTCSHLKMDGWKIIHFPFGKAYFQGRTVSSTEGSFREGKNLNLQITSKNKRMLRILATFRSTTTLASHHPAHAAPMTFFNLWLKQVNGKNVWDRLLISKNNMEKWLWIFWYPFRSPI